MRSSFRRGRSAYTATAAEPLEGRTLLSANVLFGGNSAVTEFTPDGTALRRVAVNSFSSAAARVRDVAVDGLGRVALYVDNGPYANTPSLQIFDPSTRTFTNAPNVPGWSTLQSPAGVAGNYGALATFGDTVFATDNPTGTDANRGVIEFDGNNGYAATRFDTAVSPNDLTVGQDGRLYVALPAAGAAATDVAVQVFTLGDPAGPVLDHTVTLAGTANFGAASIAVDTAGDIFAAGAGQLTEFDPTGSPVATLSTALGPITDLTLAPDGTTLAATGGFTIYLTDTALTTVRSFPTPAQSSSGSVAFGTLAGPPNTPAALSDVTPANAAQVIAGGTFTASSHFTDPDAIDLHSVTIDWGDGSAPTTVQAIEPTWQFTASHAYPELSAGESQHTYTVTYDLFDGTDHTTLQRNLAALPLTVDLGPDPTSLEGNYVTVVPTLTPGVTTYTGQWTATDPTGTTVHGQGTGTAVIFRPLDNGTYLLTYTATIPGGATASDSVTLSVANQPPSAALYYPTNFNEGDSINLVPSVTDPSPIDVAAGFTYRWTLSRNGHFIRDFTGPSSLSYTFPDDGTYTVTLVATDKDGGASAPVSHSFTVANVAPTAILSPLPPLVEGRRVSVPAFATDPSGVDTTAGFTYAWSVTKDGNPFAAGAGPSIGFTPDDQGTYAVTLTATDKDGATSAPATQTAVAANLPPTAVFSGATVAEGSLATVTFTGQSDAPADLAAGFTYSYDFNDDGTWDLTTSSPTATLPSSLTADGPATRSVRGLITDKDGGSSEYTATVTVTNQPPAVTVNGPTTAKHNAKATFTFTATDPSAADAAAGFTYGIDWEGDGKIDQTVNAGTSLSLSHRFRRRGTYAIHVWVTDKDGASGTAVWTIDIK